MSMFRSYSLQQNDGVSGNRRIPWSFQSVVYVLRSKTIPNSSSTYVMNIVYIPSGYSEFVASGGPPTQTLISPDVA